MTRKERLTVTVDADALRAGNDAVRAGRAESLSGWVNLAMAERAEKERRFAAMAEAIRLHERDFGAISDAELLAQERADRRNAVVARAASESAPRRSRKRGKRGRAA